MSTTQSDNRGLIVTCPHCGQNNRLAYEKLNSVPRCAKCGQEIGVPAEPIDVENDEQFSAFTTRSAVPVLVDFWASWCGPCKSVAPEIAKVAAQGSGRWLVAKANTELLRESARRFSVTSIPMLVLFRNGREVARHAGALPASSIRQFIERHLRS